MSMAKMFYCLMVSSFRLLLALESKNSHPLHTQRTCGMRQKPNVKDKFSTSPGVKELSKAIKKMSNVLPDEIMMLAKALNFFTKISHDFFLKLKNKIHKNKWRTRK